MFLAQYHCTGCNRYYRHCYPGIRPRYRATDVYRFEVFEAHEGGVSQRKLALTHQLVQSPLSAGTSRLSASVFPNSQAVSALRY